MTLKNNSEVATGISSGLISTAVAEQNSINYDGVSTITAVGNGKSLGEKQQGVLAAYKTALAEDAGKIGSLGTKFEAIDQAISTQMKQSF